MPLKCSIDKSIECQRTVECWLTERTLRNNNGTQQNIASLGFAVKSSKFAYMHGCQIYGNQDTLYISGSMFTFKTYIEGNIDFIFGAGSGYFLNSTIGVNEDVSSSRSKTHYQVPETIFALRYHREGL
jgi:pectin methylesterase-like acyl-CoA thioesterase